LLKSQYILRLLRMMGFADLDGRRGLTITADYVHRFFDIYLKGAPVGLLKSSPPFYPEVQFEPH
jgi:hypothetical protein